MRATIIIAFSFIWLSSFSQKLEFRTELVDTIIIESVRSTYQFDDKGTTKGKASVFSIVFNSKHNKYYVNKYFEDNYQRSLDPDTITIKKRNLINKIKLTVNSSSLNDLLKSLNETIKPNDLIRQIDTSSFLKYVTEKQIRKIAKVHNVNWQFGIKYSTRDKNRLFFESCISTDTLKTYLIDRFNNLGFTIVTDFSNEIYINIITTGSNYRFQGKYPDPAKQPWYDYSDTSKVIPTAILNLSINQNLVKILPSDFFLLETISEMTLFDDYITWYFERRNMKY